MRRNDRCLAIGLIAMLPLATLGFEVAAQSPKGAPPQAAVQTGSPSLLEVVGEVTRPLSLSAAEFAKLPRQTLRAKGHDGVESRYEGVSLIEILSRAGVPTGKELRGKAMALFVVVEASDGYRAVFGLAELDAEFTDRVVLLADRRDDKPLPTQAGTLQVVVPGEKKHARWVRQVIRLRVGRA
ncbi:MAG: molybdopterin-dependent oxidoreductase [Isosphaeraceae bacterium]